MNFMIKKLSIGLVLAALLLSLMPFSLAKADIVTNTVVNLKDRQELTGFLYSCLLKRQPDTAGLNFWMSQAGPDTNSIKHLYESFFVSSEYQNVVSQESNRDFVSQW